MMPGMPGMMKMPGMPVLDARLTEVPRSRTMPRGNNLGSTQSIRAYPSSFINKAPSLNARLFCLKEVVIRTYRSNSLSTCCSAAFPAIPSPRTPLPPTTRSNPDDLRRKTISLLEEYFGVQILDEAPQCVEELKDPTFHPREILEPVAFFTGSLLDDIGIDLPKAPNNFGEVLGNLVVVRVRTLRS
ncbi:EUKARYOTIC TRANSLATION INITIATION FACTOR 4 GAMMA [Salix viminalis]|uniref:EUKARYOTIC TRANSLATION INITIATION FACTOR 4 GAMMA n=1 Tax=Salix viminalis TaxID=40686 RepID=A0A9Q0ZRH8_SALVM|nr:EUKARYOTIC TRANSLATION INITIATION FACTOR 4 GAMMA [Salix viminalis]